MSEGKLYGGDLSPYASRCRMVIYAKGLDIAQVEPPGERGPEGFSEEYRALNPIGKIPALETDGLVLPESQVICEYLEDRFPEPSLLPSDALDAARARLLCRIADLYLIAPLFALFQQMNPERRDASVVEEKVAEISRVLAWVEQYADTDPYLVGSALTLADCAVAPLSFFATRLLPVVGAPAPFAGRPGLLRWWEAIEKDGAGSRVLAEMDAAFSAARSRA